MDDLHCAVKYKQVQFPISNKRSICHFTIVNSDIWAPSTIPNISEAQWFVSFTDDSIRMT